MEIKLQTLRIFNYVYLGVVALDPKGSITIMNKRGLNHDFN